VFSSPVGAFHADFWPRVKYVIAPQSDDHEASYHPDLGGPHFGSDWNRRDYLCTITPTRAGNGCPNLVRTSGINLNLARSIRFFMQTPSAEIHFDAACKAHLTHDAVIRDKYRSVSVTVRQFVIGVTTTRARVDAASVEVHVEEVRTLREALMRTWVQHELPSISPISWTALSGETIMKGDRITPKSIVDELFNIKESRLKPSLSHFATICFALSDGTKAYFTNSNVPALDFSSTYIIDVCVTGENLTSLPRGRYIIHIHSWNDIEVRPLTTLDLLRFRKRLFALP
jgi:hypothetical protein